VKHFRKRGAVSSAKILPKTVIFSNILCRATFFGKTIFGKTFFLQIKHNPYLKIYLLGENPGEKFRAEFFWRKSFLARKFR